MIYFTSDLHFGHSNIMRFHPCFRPFSSVEAMDSALIRLWNERVNPCDTVYNIGDISFHKDMGTNISIFSKLNGKHVLVLGNKGEAIKKHKDELLAMKKQDGNALFEEICEYKKITVQHILTRLSQIFALNLQSEFGLQTSNLSPNLPIYKNVRSKNTPKTKR